MIAHDDELGHSSLWRGYFRIVQFTSGLATLFTAFEFLSDLGSVDGKYGYVKSVFGALAAAGVFILVSRVISKSAKVWEAKVALGFVLVWILVNMPIYKEYDTIAVIILGIVGALSYLLIPLVAYAHFPVIVLLINRTRENESLGKEKQT